MADLEDGNEEFGWVARYQPQPDELEPVVPVIPQSREVGLTVAHRRALLATGVAVLLAAAVLSAAAGLRIDGRFGTEVAAPGTTSSSIGSNARGRIASTALVEPSTTETTRSNGPTSTASPTPTSEGATSLTPSVSDSSQSSESGQPATEQTIRTSTSQASRSAATRTSGSSGRPPLGGSTNRPSESTSGSVSSATGQTGGSRTPPTTHRSNSAVPTTAAPVPAAPTTTKSSPPTTVPAAVATPVAQTTSTTVPRGPMAGVDNGGIVVETSGQFTFTDVIREADGSPASGISVDLFRADQNSRRAAFVASAETDESGRYRLSASLDAAEVPLGSNPDPAADCLIAVFVAPDGTSFEETGRFREALVCPTESGASLPQVRLLPASVDDPLGAAMAVAQPRSVLASGGKLYLRGVVSDDREASELARRYQWSIGSARVVSTYTDSASAASVEAGSNPVGAGGLERVSLEEGEEAAFGEGTAKLGPEALLVTRQVATVLKWNPTARLRIVVAVDPALDEQPTAALLAARQRAVVKALGSAVDPERVELSALDTVTEGRRLGGRSINSQIEFVLLWP